MTKNRKLGQTNYQRTAHQMEACQEQLITLIVLYLGLCTIAVISKMENWKSNSNKYSMVIC